MEKVQKKKHLCAYGCGLPFLGSIWRARIRAPMKRMQSIGAKLTVIFAVVALTSSFSSAGDFRRFFDTSKHVLVIATKRYTRKNMPERRIVHMTAGLTGICWSPQISFGAFIQKTPTQTTVNPP